MAVGHEGKTENVTISENTWTGDFNRSLFTFQIAIATDAH